MEPSLKSYPTVNLAVDTLAVITVGNQEQSWRIDPGVVDPTDPNQLSPADYNTLYNNKHWIMVSSVPAGGGGAGTDVTGSTTLVSGQPYIDVVLPASQPNANWKFVERIIINTADPAPLNIWPGIVTSKTAIDCRIQLNGAPDSGNYYLNWIIRPPVIIVGGYLLSGPGSGPMGAPATFTVALSAGVFLPVPVTVIPSDGGGGGTFAPTAVTLTEAAPSVTFTYTAGSAGSKTIAATNDGGMTDPSPIAFTATVPATTYLFTGPSSGFVGLASTNFTVRLPTGTTVVAPVTITPSDGGGGGTFIPSSVILTTGAPSATFTYTPASSGAKTLSTTNSSTLTNPANLTYTATALATTYLFSGPSSGLVGAPSTNFTVQLPGGTTLAAPVTITPSDGAGGGTFTPTSVILSAAAPSATFTYTSASTGAKTLSVTNSGTLTNPANLTYTAAAAPHLLNTLISYWKLDEAGTPTSIADSQGTNTLTAANISAEAFIINNGQYMNGSGYMTVPNNASVRVSGDFTFSIWVRVDSSSPDQWFLSKWDGSTNDYGLMHSATNGISIFAGAATSAVGAPSAAFSIHHIVAWYDSSDQKCRLRIDDTTTYVGTAGALATPNTGPFRLGSLTGAPATYNWTGKIDEVGFWKRILTSTEITALYNGGAGLPFSSFTL